MSKIGSREWSWLRVAFSFSLGVWLANRWHKDFWIYGPLYSLIVLQLIHGVMLLVALVAFWRERAK